MNSIKIDDGERQRDLIHLLNYPLEKYWSIDRVVLLDSCPLHNPLHTVALNLTTIVIHLVEYNCYFEITVSIARCAYASYVIFPIILLLNFNNFRNYDGRIETPRPKLFLSNHCIWRDDARCELGTAPNNSFFVAVVLEIKVKSNAYQTWAFVRLHHYIFIYNFLSISLPHTGKASHLDRICNRASFPFPCRVYDQSQESVQEEIHCQQCRHHDLCAQWCWLTQI